MNQASVEVKLNTRKTRKRRFWEQMECIVPWAELVALIKPYYPEEHTRRPPFALETMLRTPHLWLDYRTHPQVIKDFFCNLLARLKRLSRLG